MIDEKTVKEKLKDGMVLKNYKELCATLDLPVLTSNSKNAQFKALSQYADFTKQGRQIIINKIYTTPILKSDKRSSGNHNIYIHLIEAILMNYFIKQNKVSCSFTKRELCEELGLTNGDFWKYYNKRLPLMKNIQQIDDRIQEWQIDNFYNRTPHILNDIIDKALKSLERRNLIQYNRNVMIAHKNGSFFEITSDDRKKEILDISYQCMHELIGQTIQYQTADGSIATRPTSMRDILFNNKGVTYYKYITLRNQRLKEHFGYDFVYNKYNVICGSYLKQELEINIEILKSELNAKIIQRVNDNALTEFNKNHHTPDNKFYYPDYYIFFQKLLANMLLNIDEQSLENTNQSLNYAYSAEIDELFM